MDCLDFLIYQWESKELPIERIVNIATSISFGVMVIAVLPEIIDVFQNYRTQPPAEEALKQKKVELIQTPDHFDEDSNDVADDLQVLWLALNILKGS